MSPTKKNHLNGEFTPAEIAQLWKLKNVVTKGQHAFLSVGQALLEIRENKLYKIEANTFKEFCHKSWGWGESRGRQLCLAAKLWEDEKEEAKSAGLPEPQPPKNEWESRTRTRGEKKLDAPNKALRSVTLSSSKSQQKRDYSDVYTSGNAGNDQALKDEFGVPVPAHILPLWKRSSEVEELMASVQSIRRKLTEYEKLIDPLLAPLDMSWTKEELHTIWWKLQQCLPYAICDDCMKELNNKCPVCGGRGFVGKSRWDKSLPETKANHGTARLSA